MTHYFGKKDGEQDLEPMRKQRKEKIYVPKIMMDTMIASTGNSTSIHFGFGHMCSKH